RGHHVVARNWRCRFGELDLVAVDTQGRLRFVEVRTRTGEGFGTPAESVTADKRRRLRRLAAQWLSEHPSVWRQVCVDVVGVDLADPGRPLLELFEEVFWPWRWDGRGRWRCPASAGNWWRSRPTSAVDCRA